MRVLSTFFFTIFFACIAFGQAVFINEINYNDPIAANRGVELVGPSGTTLTGWKLDLYDNGGNIYATIDIGTVSFQPAPGNIDQVWFPIAQLRSTDQNAGGVSLVDNVLSVLQFLSYGQQVIAMQGAASGQISSLIGAIDPLFGKSYQLSGKGLTAPDFAWEIAINSPGSININQFLDIPLPIELVNFQARSVASSIQIDWATLLEENLASFILEHSSDGITFNRIQEIPSKNENGQLTTYSYRHKELAMGSHYYRLTGVDHDGKEALASETITAKVNREDDITAHPNPASDYLTVHLSKGQIQAAVKIFDINGKLVVSTNTTDAGRVDVSPLVPGQYILQIDDGNTLKVISIMKR